jgi:hypothetical protein
MFLLGIVMLGGIVALVRGDGAYLPKMPRSASGPYVRIAGAIVTVLSGVAMWASWQTIKDYKD